MNEIDPRIVKVAIIIGDELRWYEGLSIEAKGIKVSNTVMGQCEITILNLRRDVREKILQDTNPFLAKGKRISVIVEVGRVGTGTTTLYSGDVFRSSEAPKPNIGVNLRCIQGHNNKGKIVSRSGKEISKLSSIAAWVAHDNGYNLSFQIPDKNIARYSFTGSAQAALSQLEDLAGGDTNVYVDDKTLYVKSGALPANGTPVRVVDKYNGLISAEGTEYGAKIKMLFDNITKIGGQIDLTSEINPSLNGSYVVRKLPFHVTSRDKPFYYIAECNRIGVIR